MSIPPSHIDAYSAAIVPSLMALATVPPPPIRAATPVTCSDKALPVQEWQSPERIIAMPGMVPQDATTAPLASVASTGAHFAA